MVSARISDFKVPQKHLEKLHRNNSYNKEILIYYNRLLEKQVSTREINRIDNKIARMQTCNTIWDVDHWKLQNVKCLVSTNLCKDKFCNNCKKVKQAQRMRKYMSEIELVGKEAHLSQMVLTVPNITDKGNGKKLKETIQVIFQAFATLIEYLKGKKKIKGIDFKQMIGYKGAIRSLEVTYKDNSYHPHLHVLIAHTHYLGQKKNVNAFSKDSVKGRGQRKFTDVEVLIQKVWRLLIDDIRDHQRNDKAGRRPQINEKRINELELGYSCMIDEFKEDDFLELFKYMTKGNGKADDEEENAIMSYNNFTTLFYGLNSVRQIQGYGCFFGVKDDDEVIEDDVKAAFDSIIESLNKKETAQRLEQTLDSLLTDKATIISKKKVAASLKKTVVETDK